MKCQITWAIFWQVSGFTVISSSFIDGYLYCQVKYPIVHSINNINFNLSEPHHVLLAYGPSQSSKFPEYSTIISINGCFTIGYIVIHDQIKTTSKKISLTSEVSVVAVGEKSSKLPDKQNFTQDWLFELRCLEATSWLFHGDCLAHCWINCCLHAPLHEKDLGRSEISRKRHVVCCKSLNHILPKKYSSTDQKSVPSRPYVYILAPNNAGIHFNFHRCRWLGVWIHFREPPPSHWLHNNWYISKSSFQLSTNKKRFKAWHSFNQ